MNKFFGLFVIVFSLVLTVTSSFAGVNEGIQAYRKGDFATALRELKPLAEQGDAASQGYLADMYRWGNGVDKDYVVAFNWMRKAAEQGYAAAQYVLGIMYEKGQGVVKDNALAIHWYRKSAEQGNARGQTLLGMSYYYGDIVTEDEKEAFNWVSKGADQGDSLAQLILADMHLFGYLDNFDLGLAEKLYNSALKGGQVEAKSRLEDLRKKTVCLKKAQTKLFDDPLLCARKYDLRRAVAKSGAKVIRVNDAYWYDQYDSSKILDGTSTLSIAYVDYKFARAEYVFNSDMNETKVVEVRNMVAAKYGAPAKSEGTPSLGPVTYTWKLKDGITLIVSRGWPDTTVTLSYIHPANFAAMESEQKRQAREEEEKNRGKQNKAF